jgi:hypothetical protein
VHDKYIKIICSRWRKFVLVMTEMTKMNQCFVLAPLVSLTYENVVLHVQQQGSDILTFNFGDVDL